MIGSKSRTTSGNKQFKKLVYECVSNVQPGQVTTYSKVAIKCGRPGAARAVGQIAHFGPVEIPWHRLVKSDGSMANGFIPGGPNHQKELLIKEGVKFYNGKVDQRSV